MPGDLDLLAVAGSLHEGVVDDDAWARAIRGICELAKIPKLLLGRTACGGQSLDLLFAHETNVEQAAILSGPLADPDRNPWLGLAQTHPLRRAATVADLGGSHILENAAIWHDFYRPYQIGDSVGAVLERQYGYIDILVVARQAHQPAFDAETIATLEQMLPHIARSWRVRRMLMELQRTVGTLSYILDRIDRAILIAGPAGDIRFANVAADRILSRANVLDARQGKLRARRPAQTRALQAIIEKAARTGTGHAAMAVDALGFGEPDQATALAIVAEPLSPVHGEALGQATDPGTLLFIGDSSAVTSPSADKLKVVYGLTDAEARLASLIVEGRDPAAAAQHLNVSINTAKFHLRNVFAKVGASRQSDLVRRVLADVGGLAEPKPDEESD